MLKKGVVTNYIMVRTKCPRVNTDKTKAIVFRPVNKNIDTDYALKIGSSQIKIVSPHKTIGVIFQSIWDGIII